MAKKLILGGSLAMGEAGTLPVDDKFSGLEADRVSLASPQQLEQAIAQAHSARADMAALPPFERAEILNALRTACEQRTEALEEVLVVEAGKRPSEAEAEVKRLLTTLRVSAEEARRVPGEVFPLDGESGGAGFRGMWKRVPRGVCSFITPFNFPLNLIAHKVGPAIAAGCPFIVKPSERTPLSALLFGEALLESGLPAGAFSILPIATEHASPLVTDERIANLSFTGSARVGFHLQTLAAKKRVTLELGGNAHVILTETFQDRERALARIVTGAFYQAGQSCISVQRVLAHVSIYEEVKRELTARISELSCGDPRSSDVGPLISEHDAKRVDSAIDDAEARGASVLGSTKPRRVGRCVKPTLLTGVGDMDPMASEEIFGPVLSLASYQSLPEALDRVNRSRYGLQAGLFSDRLDDAMLAWDTLDVGAVVVNDIPSWRADAMPYGGVKDSGLGREGVRYAIEEMTELRGLILKM